VATNFCGGHYASEGEVGSTAAAAQRGVSSANGGGVSAAEGLGGSGGVGQWVERELAATLDQGEHGAGEAVAVPRMISPVPQSMTVVPMTRPVICRQAALACPLFPLTRN